MFAKIRNVYKAWRLNSLLDGYEEALSYLDDDSYIPHELPVKLKEFWRVFDMSLLDDLVLRDVMGYGGLLRHASFPQLHQLFIDANDAIANEFDTQLERTMRLGLTFQKETDLDNYFHSPSSGSLNIKECFEKLRLVLQAHCGILENIEGTYPQRQMMYCYHDVIVLTEVILEVLRDRGVPQKA